MDVSVLKAVPPSKGIGVEDLEALSQPMSETPLKRGDSLFCEDDEGSRLYIAADGRVELSHSSDNGRENLIAVLSSGEIIGEPSLFDPSACFSAVTAIASTRLISLAHKDMMNFINQHPDMVITMSRELARRLRNTNEQMADLVFSDVPGRVAKTLIDLASRFGERTPEGIHVARGFTRGEFARLVDAFYEAVNKSLADLVSRGWIRLEGRAVFLTEIGHLQCHAH